jgi:hypothetical protein
MGNIGLNLEHPKIFVVENKNKNKIKLTDLIFIHNCVLNSATIPFEVKKAWFTLLTTLPKYVNFLSCDSFENRIDRFILPPNKFYKAHWALNFYVTLTNYSFECELILDESNDNYQSNLIDHFIALLSK